MDMSDVGTGFNYSLWVQITTILSSIGTVIYVFFTYRLLRRANSEANVNGFLSLLKWIEEGRPDRLAARKIISERKALDDLTDNERLTLDRVCKSFDILGYMDRRRLIPQEFIDELYAVSFSKVYRGVLIEHVNSEIAGQGQPGHFWELKQFFERIKQVPDQHPAITGKAAWPKNSRRQGRWRRC
ncbi:MAG: hypothetical protein HY055_18270 [Magnetospirillum sp.]|nr:hypothetical protein [Magnetospirillum sp.]